MKTIKYIGLMTVALLVASSGFAQTTIDFTEGLMLQGDNTYLSGASTISLKDGGGAFLRHGLLRLTIPTLAAGESFDSASFSVFTKDTATFTLNAWGVADLAPGQDWDPLSTTFDDVTASGMYAPQKDQHLAANPTLTLLGELSIVNGGTGSNLERVFDDAAFTTWLNSDSNQDGTIVFTVQEDTGVFLRSVDHADSPFMTYSVVPEPATLGLLGAAGFVLFAVRKKKNRF